jgi:hypothetical protein
MIFQKQHNINIILYNFKESYHFAVYLFPLSFSQAKSRSELVTEVLTFFGKDLQVGSPSCTSKGIHLIIIGPCEESRNPICESRNSKLAARSSLNCYALVVCDS